MQSDKRTNDQINTISEVRFLCTSSSDVPWAPGGGPMSLSSRNQPLHPPLTPPLTMSQASSVREEWGDRTALLQGQVGGRPLRRPWGGVGGSAGVSLGNESLGRRQVVTEQDNWRGDSGDSRAIPRITQAPVAPVLSLP